VAAQPASSSSASSRSGTDPISRLSDLADYSAAFAVRAVSSLGIADHLAGGPMAVTDLAAATGTDVSALRRVLRLLVAKDVFDEVAPDRFGLRPMAELLRTDHPLSMRDAFGLANLECVAWSGLTYSLRTGGSAFTHIFGQSHQEYRRAHPREDERMDRVQRAGTRLDVLTLVRAYDWSAVRTVVDVGGGSGAFVAGLLSRFKGIRAVLLDLPHLVSLADRVLADAGVGDRCEIIGGDFFTSIPAGADVYVLKSVLGAWDDTDAARILRNIGSAMRADSRLLIIEPIMGYGQEFTMGNIIHLQTLVLYGGPDRSEDEYRDLLSEAGLRMRRVIPRNTLPIIEVSKGEACASILAR
jgi:hypothetical protein